MNSDLLRIVDAISRDKSIDKEGVFIDLIAAMESAVRRAYEEAEDITVEIDRATGEIHAAVDGKPIDMRTLGRIAAQTAKQVMIQKIREDERSSIFDEYSQRVGEVVTGTVTRYEGGALIVNMGRAEGFLPRSEQIPGEGHQPGERVRGMILDVREEPHQVRIVLTQTHPDYIRRLFELEVPEVGERIIEIRALAREAGYRTKVAVSSIDSKVDAVGACVGVRGSRIRNIVDELNGEKIDIVRWNESSQVLITNSLKPAEIREIFLCFELGRATVVVDEDQLSLAIGRRGQNVRLAARLTGWDIDIVTPAEYDKNVDDMARVLKGIEGVEDVMLDKLLAIGIISLGDIEEVGTEPLVNEVEIDQTLATRIVEVAVEAAKQIAAQAEADKKAAEAKKQAEAEAKKQAEEAGEGAEGEGAQDDTTSEAKPEADGEGGQDDVTSEAKPEADGEGAQEDTTSEASTTSAQGADNGHEPQPAGDESALDAEAVESSDPT